MTSNCKLMLVFELSDPDFQFNIFYLVQVPGSKKCRTLGVSLTNLVESWDPPFKLLQGVSYFSGWDVLKIMRPNKKYRTFFRGGYNPN